MLSTRFTELVGCDVPLQQAPMGLLAPPGLALAVARAGGVGTVSAPIGAEPRALAAQLDAWVDGSAGALAVNFITEHVDPAAVAVAGARVRMVDFFWNTPHAKLVDAAHEGGALVNWQVGSLPDAVLAAEAGADVVTVQGREAGGHVRGDTPLLPLLAAVVRAVDVPVLAAGGIAESRALAAVLAAGAAGARIGTRFLATSESGTHPEYVLALLAAGPESTEITDGFADCPMCATLPRARVLRSAITAVAAVDGEAVGTVSTGDGDQPLPPRAGMPPHKDVHGQIHAMALYAGSGVEHVTAVRPAADVVRELAEGAEALLRAW
ncbi:NAD(P)H-dependent flavin oxidoreductase YrpB (nitropropane dioxygenase family) [Pseudonocardia hierapolitana]|uniref:NAD(P)H-dependent flavin oxidoreductase YrpB (Nitropropane dioxygenase family) n=1 Tax=Pseudonocardia hierapolitana TaxID=1128676 RepID=A0A561SWS8_9PSEU|nr:nitronate monooxygenase [Pseudonocardia hierapolitana]TWF79317.1 NAD(P)H-dependent flavin oxidoreductase YrpB (nitropropane dioxygenase family) [Pseudonocardia hierapolitana]